VEESFEYSVMAILYTKKRRGHVKSIYKKGGGIKGLVDVQEPNPNE
jgi:hypothetical protein